MLLFLDFDGVLHPVKSTIDHIFCNAPLLEEFLNTEAPSWSIVLSTSWREPHTFEQLLDFIPESLHSRVLGTTVADAHPGPRAMNEMMFARAPRQAQILHYLAQSSDSSEPWLALDDEAGMFYPGLEQLILCNPTKGLTTKTLESLRQQYHTCYNSYSNEWSPTP